MVCGEEIIIPTPQIYVTRAVLLIEMSNNLFIIGNGFDLGHGMKTAMTDFKSWLEENYFTYSNGHYFYISYPELLHDGYDVSDNAEFVMYCIENTDDGDWNKFETALGKINWHAFFDEVDDVYDKEGDLDGWKTLYAREDHGSALYFHSQSFSHLFTEWIDSLDHPEIISRNSFLIDKANSFFLSFNYTRTLEDIYRITPNLICHIHGLKGGEIVIGHCNDNFHDAVNGDFGMEVIEQIHRNLRKPTENIIKDNTDFFERLSVAEIQNIYSWGFSFSQVDIIYIQEICQRIDTRSAVWHLHNHDESKISEFTSILRACRFNGEITVFNA